MWPYVIVALFLATLLAGQGNHSSGQIARPLSLLVLIIFVGLRYQLGYDWIAYERLFEFVTGRFSFQEYDLSRSILPTEPLYYFLNVLVRGVGGSFELLLFILAAFNLCVIDRMAERIAPGSQPFVWFFYFCLAILAVQFNILRQAIASSFVILCLLSVAEGRTSRAAIYFIVGLGFQVSILMFLPVILMVRFIPSVRVVSILLTMLVTLFISGAFIGGTLIGATVGILPAFLGSKVDNYTDSFASGALSGVSPLSLLLVVAYLVYLKIMISRNNDRYTNIAVNLTLLVLVAHIGISQFPSLWNRIMCVSLPWQLAALWRTGYFQEKAVGGARQIALGASATVATVAMIYQLGRPQSVPFIPYHSALQVWLLNDQGDGRVKALYTIEQAQRQQENP